MLVLLGIILLLLATAEPGSGGTRRPRRDVEVPPKARNTPVRPATLSRL